MRSRDGGVRCIRNGLMPSRVEVRPNPTGARGEHPSSIRGEQRGACLVRSGREDSFRETELQGRGQPLSWTCVVFGVPGVPTCLCTDAGGGWGSCWPQKSPLPQSQELDLVAKGGKEPFPESLNSPWAARFPLVVPSDRLAAPWTTHPHGWAKLALGAP